MDMGSRAETYEFGYQPTSDVTVRLRNRYGRQEWFHCHSFVLKNRSEFFADRLSSDQIGSTKCIEIVYPPSDYDYYVKLLKLLYLSEDLLLDSWDCVKNALGVLRASVVLHCQAVTSSCIQYLEAVPWDDKEEEEIVKVIPTLGSAAMPILARVQPVNLNATKKVFLSAICFATTVDKSFPPFTDELKTSAQEQVEYMLAEDDETALVTVDEDVRSAVRTGLVRLFVTFETELNLLPSEFGRSPDATEQRVLQSLVDLEWMCNVLRKMEMMMDFVSSWAQVSNHVLELVQDEKYSSGLWAVKMKLIEVAGKALDAVGYGSVVLPTTCRVHLLKIWLPYLRNMKPILDSKSADDKGFLYKMDSDLCQNIEGAIISLVLTLPSNDQAEILGDWMKRAEQLKFPDLSEAFEVWCYRTKTAKRRLIMGLNGVGNPTITF